MALTQSGFDDLLLLSAQLARLRSFGFHTRRDLTCAEEIAGQIAYLDRRRRVVNPEPFWSIPQLTGCCRPRNSLEAAPARQDRVQEVGGPSCRMPARGEPGTATPGLSFRSRSGGI